MDAKEYIKLRPEEKLMRAIFRSYPDNTLYLKEVDGVILRKTIESVLSTLGNREARILRIRYGFANPDNPSGTSVSMIEVGKIFNVCRGRIWQIERKALRKLRHPTRSRLLRPYLQVSERGEE